MYTSEVREREKRQLEEGRKKQVEEEKRKKEEKRKEEEEEKKKREIEEQEKREKREIYSRFSQLFDRIQYFQYRYNFIQKRLTEVEEQQNQFQQSLTKIESTLDSQPNDGKLEYQQLNSIQKQQCNSLIIELEQKINNQQKLIQESNIKQLKQIEKQDKIWKDKIEIDIQNLLKYCPRNEKSVTNQQSLIKPKPDSIEKNGDIIKNVIEDIYSQTTRKRQVSGQYQYFVHQMQNQNDLAKNYNLKLEQKMKINQYIQGFRQVRGDGNCFYTSFGFGYLQLLIVHYDQNQYDEFLNSVIKKMRFRIQYQNTKIDDEKIETELREEFIKRLNIIRNQENKEMRQDQLFKQFSAYQQEEDKQVDGYFYALSTIFFRNLSLHFIEQSEHKDNFPEKDTLLLWEIECNSNEIVISILAEQLKINIIVFFFTKENYSMMEYNKEAKRKIILLLQPGHYNIGVPKIEE